MEQDEITTGDFQRSTRMPLDAVVRRDGQDGVFLVDEASSKARHVPVTVGVTDGRRAEILEPPLEGRVVVLGQHPIDDGTPLAVSAGGGG